jgi:hypothetical protein
MTTTKPPAAPEPQRHDDDELIVAPKGSSKLRFFLTLAAVMFVLLIFTVGDQLASTLTGGNESDGPFMVWDHPERGLIELDRPTFLTQKRALSYVKNLFEGRSARVDDSDAALFIILDDLALSSGVRITDTELGEFIMASFGSGERFKQVAANFRISGRELQGHLRRYLRSTRYQNMIRVGAVATPGDIEALWKERHQEYAFHYVAKPTAQFRTTAESQVPAAEELQDWFHELPLNDQRAYHSEESFRLSVVWVPMDGSFDSTALLAAHPRPEDEDADAQAQAYYNLVSSSRFRREAPLDDDGEMDLRTRLYLPFDEVAEQCGKEAPVYFSMADWRRSLESDAGVVPGEIDLAAAAGELGLSAQADAPPRTSTAWRTDNEWGGRYVAGRLPATRGGAFLPGVIVEEGALVVARVDERIPASEPPFGEIRERVAENWIQKHTQHLALESLQTMYDLMDQGAGDGARGTQGPIVSYETLLSMAGDAGLGVQDSTWLERSELPETEQDSIHDFGRFVRTQPDLYTLEEGELVAPVADSNGARVYLVRSQGARDAALSKMEPKEIAGLRGLAGRTAAESFDERTFNSRAFMQETYGVWIASWDYEDEAADEEG